MHILIEKILLNKEKTLFLVCELWFTRKFTFYILANLNLIYLPTNSMYLFSCVAFSFLEALSMKAHNKKYLKRYETWKTMKQDMWNKALSL